MNMKTRFAAIAALVLAAGCGAKTGEAPEAAPAGAAAPENAAPVPGRFTTNEEDSVWSELPAGATIAAVGSRRLSKEEFATRLDDLKNAVFSKIKNPRDAEKRWKGYSRQAGWDVVYPFLYRNAFLIDAEERGTVPEEKDIENARKIYESLAKSRKMTFEEFAAKRPGGPAAAERAIREEAVLAKYFSQTFSNSLEVSQKEVDELSDGLKRLNEECMQSNVLYKSLITDVREFMIRRKITFGDDSEENRKLIPKDFEVERFADAPAMSFEDPEAVAAALRGADGEWSQPVETSESYDLYKMESVRDRTAMTPALYTGWRVSIKKDLGYETPDKNELRQDIRMRKNNEIVIPKAFELMKKHGVVFPHGLCWDEAGQKARRARRKAAESAKNAKGKPAGASSSGKTQGGSK